jgi:RNA polymerase sigma-70 factor (sigma-E family)
VGSTSVLALEASGVVAFDEYVQRRSDALLRLAWLVTRHGEDARDAVQDALVKLYPRWDALPGGDRLDPYVNRSVVNACLSARRRDRPRPVAEPDLLPSAPVGDDPAEAVAAADEAWRLCGALPPVQRAAVVLRFYSGLSFAEIGEALGCAESTARSHVHRAMAALRSRLTEGRDDE